MLVAMERLVPCVAWCRQPFPTLVCVLNGARGPLAGEGPRPARRCENTHSSDLENVRLARTGIGTSDRIATQSSPFRPGGAATAPDGVLGNLLERLPRLDRAFGNLLERLPGLDRRLRGRARVICVRATRTSAGGAETRAARREKWRSAGRQVGRRLAGQPVGGQPGSRPAAPRGREARPLAWRGASRDGRAPPHEQDDGQDAGPPGSGCRTVAACRGSASSSSRGPCRRRPARSSRVWHQGRIEDEAADRHVRDAGDEADDASNARQQALRRRSASPNARRNVGLVDFVLANEQEPPPSIEEGPAELRAQRIPAQRAVVLATMPNDHDDPEVPGAVGKRLDLTVVADQEAGVWQDQLRRQRQQRRFDDHGEEDAQVAERRRRGRSETE